MIELKILGKIDLPEKKARPEEYRDLLESKMLGIRNEVNKELPFPLLDEDAKIAMYDNPDLEKDNKFVAGLEQDWADGQRKTVEQWREAKEKNPATITEMAITSVLHKLLKERFIVARASTYDDYRYGVDNVLIDKETGAVVCGFDEVLGYEGDDGGEKKDKKIKETLSRGGTSLKYGATIADGEMKKQVLQNIPTFYLSLSKEELLSLLADLKKTEDVTGNEKKIVMKMVSSLGSQYEGAKDIALNPALQKNLESFAESLEVIKDQINK